jgi:hypothetical protein
LFGFSGSDIVKSGAPGAKPLDLNALPSIPTPSFTAPKLPELNSSTPPPAKKASAPPTAPVSAGSMATGPVCAAKEDGCVQSTKAAGVPVLPAWAYPPKLKGVEAGRMLKRALEQCGASYVGQSSGGKLLKVSATFSTGLFGWTTDTMDFVIDPSLGVVAFRATSPGDSGRARGRLGRVRARLSTGGTGREVS